MSYVEEGYWTGILDLCDSETVRRGQCGTMRHVMLELLCRE